MKKVRYPAEVSRPAVLVRRKGFAVPDPNSISGQAAIENANREMVRLCDEAIVQKLHLLMEHYGIQNENDWFALARALAFEHVKGLKQSVNQLISFPVGSSTDQFSGAVRLNEKRSGRRLEWSIDRLLDLLD